MANDIEQEVVELLVYEWSPVHVMVHATGKFRVKITAEAGARFKYGEGICGAEERTSLRVNAISKGVLLELLCGASGIMKLPTIP